MKWDKGIEQCQYCDMVHHPMTRWTRGDITIFVHDLIVVDRNLIFETDSACHRRAIAEGFVRRPDLTPKR